MKKKLTGILALFWKALFALSLLGLAYSAWRFISLEITPSQTNTETLQPFMVAGLSLMGLLTSAIGWVMLQASLSTQLKGRFWFLAPSIASLLGLALSIHEWSLFTHTYASGYIAFISLVPGILLTLITLASVVWLWSARPSKDVTTPKTPSH